MRDSLLPFSPPLIGQDAIDEVIDTLRSDWITSGPKVKRFEQEFAQFIGAPAALAVSSATDAMQVGLASVGIGKGDEVITPSMTFCSSAHVIEHLGARPVLIDVLPDTLNLDPARVADAITSRTRALLPVHLYGHPCNMDDLQRIASQHELHILEDAAHALPASYRGSTIGSQGSLAAFSFYATKNLTTAEGGMLTGPEELIDRARIWSLHGMSRDAWKRYSAHGSWFYEVVLPGFKCNMTDIQASLGIHQLRRLPDFQARREQIARQYNQVFSSMQELQIPTVKRDVEHAWHIYALRLVLDRLTIDRAQFIKELGMRNIGTSVHFIPVHLHPYYRDRYGYQPDDFPVAFREYQRLVSLPIYPRMTDSDVQDVVEAVADVVRCFRR